MEEDSIGSGMATEVMSLEKIKVEKRKMAHSSHQVGQKPIGAKRKPKSKRRS